MARTRRTIALVAACSAVAVAPPLPARGADVPGGFVLTGHVSPYQRWIEHSRMPPPPGEVAISLQSAGCVLPVLGCMIWRDPPMIRLGRDGRWDKHIFFHELGHVFDYHALDWDERDAFAVLNNGIWDSEVFGDAYRNCTLGDRLWHPAYGPHSGWAPTPKRKFRRSCRMIREFADPVSSGLGGVLDPVL